MCKTIFSKKIFEKASKFGAGSTETEVLLLSETGVLLSSETGVLLAFSNPQNFDISYKVILIGESKIGIFAFYLNWSPIDFNNLNNQLFINNLQVI